MSTKVVSLFRPLFIFYGMLYFTLRRRSLSSLTKGATAREMLARVTLALENLPFFLQPGCRALNKGSIEFSNNSRIIAAATSGSSIRGMSVNLLFLDEFAFVERAAEFYTSTYPVISSGKDTKVIITSTANGIGNTYHKIWEGAVQKVNEYKAFTVNWWDVPGRDEEWKRQTISNTSQLQFDQEFGNCLESRSQITVLINNIIYEIRIGDFYDCIRTRETLGLSFEEEVRLKSNTLGLPYNVDSRFEWAITKGLIVLKVTISMYKYLKNLTTETILKEREEYWINSLDTFNNGLNESPSGKGCGHNSPNFTTLGYKFSDEQRKKMSESAKKRAKREGFDIRSKRSKENCKKPRIY